jgi:hypothetical protein
MINTSKNSILTYAIIVLLVINIVVTGTVLCQKYCHHRKGPDGCQASGKHMDKELCMSEFLHNDLNFSKKQMDQFHQLKSEFHPVAKTYFDSLEMLENKFFTEITKPQTDTAKLYSFAREFGRIQYGLKHKTIEHLIKIKMMCSPDQQIKYFDHITKNRHCREGMEMPPPPGEKHGCPEMKK